MQDRIGQYTILRRLAVGGMAELFLARSNSIGQFEKLVAFKRILPQHACSEDFVRMFLDEARLAAHLDHRNVVHVYDVGEYEDTYFFTMEYVHGRDLRKINRRSRKLNVRMPLEHALTIVIGVCSGLQHAHTRCGLDGKPLGIVHRDISPPNVLVTFEGGVKVVDFGIAKAATAQVMTAAGTLKGKIPYMSPEQVRCDTLDLRSDIFSIGILLWELTIGTRLYSGDNEITILQEIAKKRPQRPSAVVPSYPRELERIVMRALAVDRGQRYQTAEQMLLDLEAFAFQHRLLLSPTRLGHFMGQLFETGRSRPTFPPNALEAATAALRGLPANDPDFMPPSYPDDVTDAGAETPSIRPAAGLELEPSRAGPLPDPLGLSEATYPPGNSTVQYEVDPPSIGSHRSWRSFDTKSLVARVKDLKRRPWAIAAGIVAVVVSTLIGTSWVKAGKKSAPPPMIEAPALVQPVAPVVIPRSATPSLQPGTILSPGATPATAPPPQPKRKRQQ